MKVKERSADSILMLIKRINGEETLIRWIYRFKNVELNINFEVFHFLNNLFKNSKVISKLKKEPHEERLLS